MSDTTDNGEKATFDNIERVRTAQYVPGKHGEDFERQYLAPEIAVQGQLRKIFGNPTPIALGGFLMANRPATIDLMGWGGAGGGTGNAAAGNASYFFFGGILLIMGGIGEWVLGNTFPSTVFFTFGSFWLTFGGTLTPFFAALSSYTTPDGKPDPAGFYDSFAYFLIFMAVFCLVYMICALRTNIILVFVLFTFVLAFPCLTASYFYGAMGLVSRSNKCRIVGGAFAFSGSMAAWYLFLALLFESVDFPVTLPIGDLSTRFKGKSDGMKERV